MKKGLGFYFWLNFRSYLGYENFLFPIFALICMGGSLLVVAVYQVGGHFFLQIPFSSDSDIKNRFLTFGLWTFDAMTASIVPCCHKLHRSSQGILPNSYDAWRSSHQRCSTEKTSLKHFTIFRGRHLRWDLFLIKLQPFRPADSNAVVFLWILQNF